jgi:hypothetical protein
MKLCNWLSHIQLLVWVAAGAFFAPRPAAASVPPLGYRIESRSTCEYLIGGERRLVRSNPAVTEVGPYYRIRLTPPGTVSQPAFSLLGLEGDSLYCIFELANVGNVADSVEISSSLVAPSTIELGSLVFFHDANLDYDFDPGEDERAFLNIAPGERRTLSALVVLPKGYGGGTSYIELRARVGDGIRGDSQTSVFLAATRSEPRNTLYIGPAENPRASPGGEGSPDDLSRSSASFSTPAIVFENDVLNEGRDADVVQIEPADSAGWPEGLDVVLEDSTGEALASPAADPKVFFLGALESGESRRIRVRVTPRSESFYGVVNDSLAVRVRARSVSNPRRANQTEDRVVLAEPFDENAVLSLEQTFKENQAGFGDIVTLVVSVTNLTDSVTVEDVVVSESVLSSLDFLSSGAFRLEGGRIEWRAGALAPRERRDAVVKFAVNSRVSSGWAKATGDVHGLAFSRDVHAGPVVNTLRIDNDVFSDEGIVLGDVFLDDDGDGKRDDGEEGVPRVGVFLESGEYALTDSTGRFSIPRAFSGYRIVRIDEGTLPASEVDIAGLVTRTDALYGTERIVHLLPSGHAVVSFPLRRKFEEPVRVSRQVTCGQMVSVAARRSALYRWPSIPSSFFEVGKAYLKTGTLSQLDPILEVLGRNPGWMVFLEGHTDSVPIRSEAFPSNRELSEARARAVARYLAAKGLAEERVIVRGYGDARPVATNATRAGRAANRRVDVSLVPPGTSVDEEASLKRVDADASSIGGDPDSLAVRVVWEIATDSPSSADANIALGVPEVFRDVSVSVSCGGEEIAATNGSYRAAGFEKSRGIVCELSFTAAAADTARLGEVRAVLENLAPVTAPPPTRSRHPGGTMNPPQARLHPGGTMNPPRSAPVVLAPFEHNTRPNGDVYIPILSWEEKAPAPPQAAAGPAVGRQTLEAGDGDSSRVATEGAAERRIAAGDTLRAARDEKVVFGILDPPSGSIVAKRDQIEVTARVPLGSAYSLRSGGAEVPAKQIGRKEIHLDERFEDVTWYGVKIENGWNTIALAATPVDGSSSVSDSVSVALSGKPVNVALSPDRIAIPADGKSGATIRVELRDDLGLPAINGLAATVIEGDTLVANPDQDPDQPGLQLPSEDGAFLIRVRPSNTTGRGTIGVESHGARASCLVAYVPPDRTLFLSGIVEGSVGAFDASGSGDPLGLDDFDDGVSFAGESRFFVQGTAFGGINLTARVDTKKRYDDPLLKTDNPETQYPIYGDASELHYAAPARSGNYVALEKGQSYLRYGDFRSPLTEGEFLAFKRSATGLDATFASGANALSAFVTKTDFYTVRDEIPGDGTSGYYYLSRAPVVENSVDLTLEVRDRYRPEKILERKPLVEHRDFTVSYYNGALLFKEPVPAFTAELNPVTIAAIYEARSSERGDYLYGARGDVASGRRYRAGVTALVKDGEQADYALYGADGSLALGPLDLSGELAQSDDDVAGKGNAYKIQLAAKNLKGEHSLYFRRVDGGFLNPSFTGSAHELYSRKVGLDSRLALSPRLSVDTHAFQHRFDNTGEEKSDVDVFGKYDGPRFMFGGGARAARQTRDGTESEGFLSMIGAGVKAGARAELKTHWEMNLGKETVDDYPDRIRSALSYSFREGYKAVATHEYLSAHGRPATHQLLAGLEARAGRTSTVYTRYSMTRTAGDERLGTILGLKQFFPIDRYVRGSLDIEGFRSFSSRLEDEYVALKAGLGRIVEGESAVEGRYEYRWQRAADRHLIEVNAVKELDNGVAVLFKDALSLSANEGRPASLRMEGRLAGAYRPVVTPLRALLLLKTEYDRYSPVDPEAIRWTTVLSTDVNVFPQPAHELRLKLAFKRMEDYSHGISGTSRNYLVLSQYVYHFARKWDLDAWARFLGRADGGTRQTGFGLELGRVLFDRVRIGAGYSVDGFEDRDMAENEAWERGFGVRVQLILSDWMFNGYEF